MKTVRRAAYATFAVACLHLVFGAIVRITGSGMGCGPHWPKCYGYWFPPMSRPDLVIEVTHRYLASVLLLSLIVLVVTAWRHRGAPGVGGRGGVLRPAATALALGFGAALLGAVTVKFQNAPLATLAHWTVAMSLVAAVAASVVRAGGLGGASATLGGGSVRAWRGARAAAGLALVAVVMGGLTAKTPGAPVACSSFLPFCKPIPDVSRAAVHVQVTHRWIAVLLILHLVGLFFGFRKRREAPVVRRAGMIALGLGVLQLLVAGAMIGMHLPPVLRSLHEATGVSIWITCFVLALLSRIASDPTRLAGGTGTVVTPPELPLPESGVVRAEPVRGGSSASVVASDAPIGAVATPAIVSESAQQPVGSDVPSPEVVAVEAFVVGDDVDERGVLASLAMAAVGAEGASRTARELLAEADAKVEADVAGAAVETVEIAEIIDGIAAVGAGSGQETWEAEYWVADREQVDGGEPIDAAATSDPLPVSEAVGVAGEMPEGVAIAEFELGGEVEVVDAFASSGISGAAVDTDAGGPPHVTDTTEITDLQHQSTAPRTIFDVAPTDDEDDAALLAALGPDPFDDADDLATAEQSDDAVLSLDEEFSRRAVELDVGDEGEPSISVAETTEPDAAVTIPPGVTLPGSVTAPAGAPTYHSVFVIVARGAGF